MRYLHKNELVHGDLKGVCFSNKPIVRAHKSPIQLNILMNNDHRAVIADFGLAAVMSSTSLITASATGGGTVRWMAPELLMPEEYGLTHSKSSKESDVYAFGMVIYEVRVLHV